MDTNNAAPMIRYSGGLKQIAFHIRRYRVCGSTSLLINNRFGVWSVVRYRHIKKTWFLRFHKLKDDARLIEKRYVLLRKLGLNDEQITFWRRRLAEVYWNSLSPGHRAHVTEYFRQVRRNRRILHFVFYPVNAVLFAVLCVLLAELLMFDVLTGFCILLLCVSALYITGINAWRSATDDTDTIFVQMLAQLACKCKEKYPDIYQV